ncbi:MAG: type II toxin-antitoxin system VapC family toxin [Deltaproteobacteria bacterium]|nr:type II toxin-antitoxin system VapC family toxin [Deltaproteobacteria bacterium]
MKYLIDTHIFLWSLFSPKKIPKPTVQIIKKSENEIFVSCITFWEISIKYSLNKLELEAVLPDELPNFAKRMNFEILNLTAEDAASFYRLPRTSHKDPFDRMIIRQAIREKMLWVSKDSEIPADQKFALSLLDLSDP